VTHDRRLHEHKGAARRVDLLAVDREGRVSLHHEIQLLVVLRRILIQFVVFLDHLVACLAPGPGVDAEGLDSEPVADGQPSPEVVREPGQGLDVGQVCGLPAAFAHRDPPLPVRNQ